MDARLKLSGFHAGGIRVSRQQRQLFEAWGRQDPVDTWEMERERRIAEIGGAGNLFVSKVLAPARQ